MRPRAADCKVGTKHTGYVVKTKKANPHSNRRVKYWARVPLKRPKKSVKPLAKPSAKPSTKSKLKKKTKRRLSKPRLRGGANDYVYTVVKDIANGNSALMEHLHEQCSLKTHMWIKISSSAIHDILKDKELDQDEKISAINHYLFEDFNVEVSRYAWDGGTGSSMMNAYAILWALFSHAYEHEAGRATPIKVELTGKVDGVERTETFDVSPDERMWATLQTHWPVCITRIEYKKRGVSDIYSNNKFSSLKLNADETHVFTVMSPKEVDGY